MWNHQRLRSSVALVLGDFASSPAPALDTISHSIDLEFGDLAASSTALPLTSKLTQGDSLHFSGNGVLIYKIELFFEDL